MDGGGCLEAVHLEVLGEVPVHGARLVLRELLVEGGAAHEVERVRVPVIPVVAATGHLEELHAARAAVAGSAGGQVRASADELAGRPVPLPVGYAGPHAVVVRPEILVAHD